MITDRDFERNLPAILEDLYLGPSPDYRDEVLATAVRTRQRSPWTFAGRWLPMDIATRAAPVGRLPWRQIGILAVIAVLLAVALAIAVGSQQERVPAPFGPARNGLIPYVSGGNIYTGDPSTGQTQLVLDGAQDDAIVGYSPDGTRIAFIEGTRPSTDQDPAPIDLYTMRADGARVTKISSTPLNGLNAAVWTPDSRKVAAAYWDGGWSRLAIYDADGKQPPIKVATPANPDWLTFRPPNGKELLFRGRLLYPADTFGLYVMNADGTNIRTLIEPTLDQYDEIGGATYSADGSRIFYQRWFKDSVQLWVMNADGSDAHRFVADAGHSWDGSPAVSPDGRWVAFWHNADNQPKQHVAVVLADGTGPIIETGPELTSGAQWVWSPDSTRILMFPDGVDPTRAFLLDPQGGPFTTVPWTSGGDLDWQRLAP